MSAELDISRPIRVLELRSVWGTGGGPEKTIILGAARSDPSKYSVTVCYIRDKRDPAFGPASRAEGLPVDYTEILERSSLDFAIWPKLRHLIGERRIDIIHSHDYKTNLLALLLARAEGVIPMATAHGWTGHTRKERIYYYFDKFILRRFPLVIAVSSEIRAALVRIGSRPDRIRVVLNGIDAQAFQPTPGKEAEARAQLQLPLDRTILGAVGRLEPQKRFDLLIEVFASLQRQFPKLFLAIAGDGTLRQDLNRLAEQYNLNGSFKLLGHQSDIIKVHHAFDLFVQSSKYEGTPNVVLEAMAMGTPIVATNVGGTAEIARDNIEALIIPPNDLGALFRAIKLLLEDTKSAQHRARAARHRVETELSFDARMSKVEALYDQLAAYSSSGKCLGRRKKMHERVC